MSVFRGAALYAVGNLLSKAIFFLVVPIVSAKLGVQQYGVFSSIETLFSLLPALMTLSIETGIFRIYYDYNDADSRRRYLGTIYISVICVAALFSAVMLVFPKLTHWLFPQIAFNPYFMLAIGIGLMNSLLSVPKVILQVEERALDFSIITFAQAMLTIIAVLLIVVRFNGGAVGYLNAILWVNAALVPIAYFVIRKSISWSFDFSNLWGSLKFSLPVLPSVIFSWILNASDRSIMGRYITSDQVGIYSLGWKYSTLATLAISSINTALAPMFYRIMNSGRSDSREAASKILEISMFVMISVCYVNSIIGFDAVKFFAQREFSEASVIVMILCGISSISSLGSSLNLQFYQSKMSYFPVIFTMCAGGISVLINYAFVPKVGIYSPPLAFLAVNVFLFIAPYFFAQRICPIPYKWHRLAAFISILVCLRCGAYYIKDSIWGMAINYLSITALVAIGAALYKRGHLNAEFV